LSEEQMSKLESTPRLVATIRDAHATNRANGMAAGPSVDEIAHGLTVEHGIDIVESRRFVCQAVAGPDTYRRESWASRDDIRAHVELTRPVIADLVGKRDERYIHTVLDKMFRFGVDEVRVEGTEWAEAGIPRQSGTRAMERICSPEVQPFILRTFTPKSRHGLQEAAYIRARGGQPRTYYRLRHVAPVEAFSEEVA
jgi:hypothetical protein